MSQFLLVNCITVLLLHGALQDALLYKPKKKKKTLFIPPQGNLCIKLIIGFEMIKIPNRVKTNRCVIKVYKHVINLLI